jgi:hypothetical protein
VHKTGVLIFAGALGVLAGCSATGHLSTTGGGTSPGVAPGSTTTPVQIADLVVTDQVRAQLVATGAALNGIPASEYTGLRPGETYYGYDPATKTYWAGAGLVPSPSSMRAQVAAQDDGAYVLFERPDAGTWKAYDVGLAGMAGSPCPVAVPAGILRLWGWHPGSCQPPTL